MTDKFEIARACLRKDQAHASGEEKSLVILESMAESLIDIAEALTILVQNRKS